MKKMLLAGMIAFTAPAYAAPTELPAEMMGYWASTKTDDPHNWPGAMHRIPEWSYEWGISQTEWVMWDGICKIHDVKQLGEMDYEVGATCGQIDGLSSDPFKMDLNEAVSEDRYQFTLCGEILNIRVLKDENQKIDQPAQPQGCKIS